jgi:hypothetical protein
MLSRGRGGELFGKVISAGTARQDVRAQGRQAVTTPTEHPFELLALRDWSLTTPNLLSQLGP